MCYTENSRWVSIITYCRDGQQTYHDVNIRLLGQADELPAVLVANSYVTASREELHHLAVAQQSGVHQLFTKPELKCLLVHVLHGLQQVYLNINPNFTFSTFF